MGAGGSVRQRADGVRGRMGMGQQGGLEYRRGGLAAARRGRGDMVAGHVIGSSLFNLLAIVGGMAAFQPLALPASFVRFELPAVMVLALLVYPLLRSDRQVSRQEGAILCLAFVAWVALE